MHLRKVIIFILIIGLRNNCHSQINWKFSFEIERNDYYFLKGKIDNRYEITMKLFGEDILCGNQNVGFQYQNKGLRGWFYYDRYKKKIPIIGSCNFQ